MSQPISSSSTSKMSVAFFGIAGGELGDRVGPDQGSSLQGIPGRRHPLPGNFDLLGIGEVGHAIGAGEAGAGDVGVQALGGLVPQSGRFEMAVGVESGD